MRIHQITDLHVPDNGDDERFAHIRPYVLRQLDFVAADSSDLLVLSGDLTNPDASMIGCEWIKAHLPDVDVVVIPGNHDDPGLLWQVFGEAMCRDPAFYFSLESSDANLIFLNTTSDRLPDEQIAFLGTLNANEPRLLFVHHPPHLIGDGFMSTRQPLLNHAVAAAAIRNAGISHVFCGHYHNTADLTYEGFELHLTPSPAFQINLASKEFQLEELTPAVRRIDVVDGVIETALVSV